MAELVDEPAFRAYLCILRRRKWWVASFTLLGLGVGLGSSLTATKVYSATAQVLVQPSAGFNGLGSVQLTPVTQTDVQTQLQLITSAPVQQTVRDQLKSRPAVSASEVGQTNVIAITATSRQPSRAALVANDYATAFVQYSQSVASRNLTAAVTQLRSQISSIAHQASHGNSSSPAATALLNQEAVLKEQLAQMQVSGAVDTGGIELVTPAETPTAPSSPQPAQDLILGLAAGLALGLGAGFLRDSLDDRVRTKEAAEQAAGAPVLAVVPLMTYSRRRLRQAVALTDPTSPVTESYRSLRTALQFSRQERQLRSLVMTSPGAGDGKTFTLANLGVVFAQAGERVLLVSCDLRRPCLGELFGLDEGEGLTSVLLGRRTLEAAILPVPGVERLSLLPAGPLPANPAELINSIGIRDVLASTRDRFDLVLIDSPPVLPVTDAALLSQQADATLMLAADGQTRLGDLHRAVEKLDQVGATVLGTVLNKVTRQTGRSYGYGYGYSYKHYKPARRLRTPQTFSRQNDYSE